MSGISTLKCNSTKREVGSHPTPDELENAFNFFLIIMKDKVINGEAITPEQVAKDNDKIEVKWTLTGSNIGVSAASHWGGTTPIDEIIHGVLGWGIHNYWDQFKQKIPEDLSEEKAKEELRTMLYFKIKTLMYGVFMAVLGDFDEIKFNKAVYKMEQDAIKAMKKEEKKSK